MGSVEKIMSKGAAILHSSLVKMDIYPKIRSLPKGQTHLSPTFYSSLITYYLLLVTCYLLLVLLAIAIVLTQHLNPHLSPKCYHLAGTGGLKGAVREVSQHQDEHTFVFRTDVKGYYASINHHLLMDMLGQYVREEEVLALLWGYLRRYVSDGEKYIDITQGISLGCPLSPLMGALYLKPLDDAMADLGCFYVRYMDDWVILTPTRWKLRKAIKVVNQVLEGFRLEKHPDKTFIGRITRGFDFLGYWFSPGRVGVAKKTVDRMLDKVSRLYEQGVDRICIETYVNRWWRWVRGGMDGVLSSWSVGELMGDGVR